MASLQYEGRYLLNQGETSFIDLSKCGGFELDPIEPGADIASPNEVPPVTWQIIAHVGAKTKALAHYTTEAQARHQFRQLFDMVTNGDAKQHRFEDDEGPDYTPLTANKKNRGGVDDVPQRLSRPVRRQDDGNVR